MEKTNHTWLNDLQIALINQDEIRAYELSANLPNNIESYSIEELQKTAEFIKQTSELLESKKLILKKEMEYSKKIKNFLENQ